MQTHLWRPPGRRIRLPRSIIAILASAALALTGLLGAVAAAPQANAATCGTTNIALNRPATASSLENSGFPASNAVDGNTGTRWSSAFSDPQWLEVDLGKHAEHLPGHPELGGRLRHGLPDPDLRR